MPRTEELKKLKVELLELKKQKVLTVNDKYRIQRLQQLLDSKVIE